eukprot:444649-Prymnesium_polylepis.1
MVTVATEEIGAAWVRRGMGAAWRGCGAWVRRVGAARGCGAGCGAWVRRVASMPWWLWRWARGEDGRYPLARAGVDVLKGVGQQGLLEDNGERASF